MKANRDNEVEGFSPTSNNQQRNKKVLLVAENSLAVSAFSKALQNSEIELKSATSADRALEMIRSEQFAVAVSDFETSIEDGIWFLEQARFMQPEIVRVLVTGQANFDSLVDVINRVGLFSFVVKPFDAATLESAISGAIDRYEMARTNRELTAELAMRCSELTELNRTLEAQVQTRSSFLLGGLINALDLRDTERHWHSRRVALLARCLAQRLGIGGQELIQIERGALLHDVGKVGVSDMILKKRGPLTIEERAEMKRHSEYGYRILEGIDFLDRAREIVWQHHERWNGSGYPRGLKGPNIDLGARIFAVIDTYDAMTSDRPYRKAMHHEIAKAEIEMKSGLLFDPEVVWAWRNVSLNEIDSIRMQVTKPSAGLD